MRQCIKSALMEAVGGDELLAVDELQLVEDAVTALFTC
jgi:hypothetical protein